VLFHEANQTFTPYYLKDNFARFERAAAKGHKESIWILSVVKDVEMEESALKEAFAKTEEPLGWYFAGELSKPEYCEEQFDFFRKSAEGGCSWGQVWYGRFFHTGYGWNVEKDEKIYLEWLEKAANQNNPWAMYWLGDWFRGKGDDAEKAVAYYRAAAELDSEMSMVYLSKMLRDGEGCAKDLRQAVIWGAKGDYIAKFRGIRNEVRLLSEDETNENLGCDFDELCYSLGWGFYWHQYGSENWKYQTDEEKLFYERCLDYYCSCVELQQESIFTFLLCWNRTTGVKPPGQMIAEMVWEEREDNLVKPFEKPTSKSTTLKRIKK
jgi:hypothetical protein